MPDHLPRRTVEHDRTAAEKACPGCGHERACIGTQAAEQLDYDPAAYFVRRTVRRVYACRHCDPTAVPAEQRLATAGPPMVGPVPKGLCGPGLLAFVVTSKFADHLPLHRLAGMIGQSGGAVAPSTLGDWAAAAADLLAVGSSPDAEAVRHARRQAEAVPVLAEFRGWLDRHHPGVLPKTPLGQAIGYARTYWDALRRYTDAGFLTIDNNRSERVLRQVAVGWNNWGAAGSAAGGHTAAVLYSVVATCRQLGADPFAYLRAALPALFEMGEHPSDADLTSWLPDVWLARRSAPSPALAG